MSKNIEQGVLYVAHGGGADDVALDVRLPADRVAVPLISYHPYLLLLLALYCFASCDSPVFVVFVSCLSLPSALFPFCEMTSPLPLHLRRLFPSAFLCALPFVSEGPTLFSTIPPL